MMSLPIRVIVVGLALGLSAMCAAADSGGVVFHVSAAGTAAGDGSAQKPWRTLHTALTTARPGTTIELDAAAGPLAEEVAAENVRGERGKPIVLRGRGPGRATLHGSLRLRNTAHVVIEELTVEPRPGARATAPGIDIDGTNVTLRDVTVNGTAADGWRLAGTDIAVRGGQAAACDGWGARVNGSVRFDGWQAMSCRQGGLSVSGDALVANCRLQHNRGPALQTQEGATLRFFHNLAYDNSGGLLLDAGRTARVFNNLFVNNFATTLLSPQDVELSVRGAAEIDYNIYFRHPAKDKLLSGLPYAQGVDLGSLPTGHFCGLRLRCGDRVVTTLGDKPWAERFDAHSQSLDILQRLTGLNSYTRCYEDLFADLQQENFRPRYTSPAVGRGIDLTADVPADCLGQARSAKHPDIGPYAAPAAWWEDLDGGRATLVDGSVPLNERGRDIGVGTAECPFSTLAKAAAFARWGSRIYIKDSIYRHTAVQTTFSLGPDSVLSGLPGHRPVFSPSEFIAPQRWEKADSTGLYRLRDWHTSLGYNCRHHAWMLDFYGNGRIGGLGENVTNLRRDLNRLAEPFRPVSQLILDRDTPQVLADGVALQQAGGVLGLEDFSIGTMSAWGRDVSHLRPGSFMVGRRDYLLSRAVGREPLQDGQTFLAGLNRHPEQNYRIRNHATGYVSEFVAWPPSGDAWRAVHTYAGGDRLWRLSADVCASFGPSERRRLTTVGSK